MSSTFPVDGSFLMVLPRAAASIRNPDVQLPILRADQDGYFLEVEVEADSSEQSEVAITRRVSLEDLTEEQWRELKAQYAELDLSRCSDEGITNALEKIQDRRIQRMFLALLTFLNPRQVGIVLYLYRLAARQDNGSQVTFRSNDLLDNLGYSRMQDGSFTARSRSQLNQDLVNLHRTELVMAKSLRKGDAMGAKVVVKSILRIREYEIDSVHRDFDLSKAADYTYELADEYTVSLEFFEGPQRTGDFVLFSSDIDIKQRLGVSPTRNYKLKLITYLASRMKWDTLQEGQYLTVSQQYLLKNLDLLGSNRSRNSQLLWRTIDDLKVDGYILNAQEVEAKKKKKSTSIRFQINPDKLRSHSEVVSVRV